nr:hypothetical protein [Klebsiella pneumoniae]
MAMQTLLRTSLKPSKRRCGSSMTAATRARGATYCVVEPIACKSGRWSFSAPLKSYCRD